jgi:protoporphyrinogen oxidase
MANKNTGSSKPGQVVVIGAGPGGLSTAYELGRRGVACEVLEKDTQPGGIARTESYKGYLFDLGGHRFFTKISVVQKMWEEILGGDFVKRPRMSRIFFGSKFFRYPLSPWDALSKLGPFEAARCLASYVMARIKPIEPEVSFADWVSNRFGRRLFTMFFRTYTEKVWGMPCEEIGAEWASQRIKGLNLTEVIKNAFLPQRNATQAGGKVIKTLIDEFLYPRRGPGMMWERCAEIVEERGSRVHYRTPVEKILWEPGRVLAVKANGRLFKGDHFVSTMPIRDLLQSLDPAPPPDVLAAAGDFHYRDFLIVALILQKPDPFPDNWIYIHDPSVKVGRIQNFRSWSPEMVPDPDTSCVGMEYFCFEGDGLWNSTEAELVERATAELVRIGLAKPEDVVDGRVTRVPKAYPIYDNSYKRGLEKVRGFLATVPNLQLIGRNGMHQYNNQDHSVLTGLLAARNIMGANYDLWSVNAGDEYHESGSEITEDELRAFEKSQPLVPIRIALNAKAAGASIRN